MFKSGRLLLPSLDHLFRSLIVGIFLFVTVAGGIIIALVSRQPHAHTWNS
jgi:hypothetical protein